MPAPLFLGNDNAISGIHRGPSASYLLEFLAYYLAFFKAEDAFFLSICSKKFMKLKISCLPFYLKATRTVKWSVGKEERRGYLPRRING